MNKKEINGILKEAKKLSKTKTEEELFEVIARYEVENTVLKNENLELTFRVYILQLKIDKPWLFKKEKK